MKTTNTPEKGKLELKKKIIVKLSSSSFIGGTDTHNTASSTESNPEAAFVVFLTQ